MPKKTQPPTPQTRTAELLRANVKSLMAARKIRPIQLASGINISQPQMSLFLNSKRALSFELVDSIADYFGVSEASLFQDPSHPARHLTDDQAEIIDALTAAEPKTVRAVKVLLDLERPIPAAQPAAVSTEAASELLAKLLTEVAGRQRPAALPTPARHAPPRAASGTSRRR